MVQHLEHLAFLLVVFVTLLHAATFAAVVLVRAIKEIRAEIKKRH